MTTIDFLAVVCIGGFMVLLLPCVGFAIDKAIDNDVSEW